MRKDWNKPCIPVKHPYFAQQLIARVRAMNMQLTPISIANALNSHYKSIVAKPHTVRKWLLGETLPRSETLILLGNWLKVDPKELISQQSNLLVLSKEISFEFDFTDQDVIAKYLAMTVKQKVAVRLLIDAIADINQ